jgi:hypothetical protein
LLVAAAPPSGNFGSLGIGRSKTQNPVDSSQRKTSRFFWPPASVRERFPVKTPARRDIILLN